MMDYDKPVLRRTKHFNYLEHWGGAVNAPDLFADWDTLKCNKCDIKPIQIDTKEKFCSTMTDRGRLNKKWDEVTIQCQKCKAEEKYNTESIESDGSYYSNEERQAYRM